MNQNRRIYADRLRKQTDKNNSSFSEIFGVSECDIDYTTKTTFIHKAVENRILKMQRVLRTYTHSMGGPTKRVVRCLGILLFMSVMCIPLHAQLSIDAGPDANICEGFSTTLGKTFSGGKPPYKISWAPSADLSDATALNPIVTPTKPFVEYVVTITDVNGLTASDTVNVSMFVRPIADAGSNITACVGTNVVLGGAQTARSGTPPYAYEWLYLPPNSTSPTLANPSFTAVRQGYTKVVVHVIDAKGCEDWDTVDVLVNQPLNIKVGKGFDGCAFVPHEIGGLGISGGGVAPYRYRWFPAHGLSSADVPNPLAFPDTTTWYSVTVTDNQGCSITDSVLVTIKPRMHLNLQHEYRVCSGKKVGLAAANFVSGGFAPYRYKWFAPPNQKLSNDTIPDPTVVPFGQGRILFSVWIQDARGCEIRDTVFVTMTEPPGASFVLPPSLCQNEDYLYGVSGQPNFLYSWNIIGGQIEAGQGTYNVTVKWTHEGVGQIVLNVTDTASGCVFQRTGTTLVLPLPQPKITIQGKSILCPGSTTVLDAGPGYRRYRWSNGQNTQKITVFNGGEYSVTVTDTNGCMGSSPSVLIVVKPTPTPVISGPDKICGGVPIHLHATPGFTTYTWSTGEQDSVITVMGPGNYKVYVVDDNGCSGESQVFRVDPRPVVVDKGGDIDFVAREIELHYPTQDVFFKNSTAEDILIDTLFLASTNTDILIDQISLNGSLVPLSTIRGTRIRQNDRLLISLLYDPTYIDTNTYRVQVVVSTPCWDTVHIDGTIQSYDKRMWATVSLPKLYARPAETIQIPIRIQFDSPKDSVEDASLDFAVRLNGYLLDVIDDTGGALRRVDNTPDSWRIVHLHFDHLTIKYDTPRLLTNLNVMTLASQTLSDTMFVDNSSIQWTEGSVLLKKPRVRTENGLITLSSYCFPHDVILDPADATSITLLPNPASDVLTMNIDASVAGDYLVDIYTPEGMKLRSKRYGVAKGSNAVKIDLGEFASGIYPIVVTTPSHVEIQHLVISK